MQHHIHGNIVYLHPSTRQGVYSMSASCQIRGLEPYSKTCSGDCGAALQGIGMPAHRYRNNLLISRAGGHGLDLYSSAAMLSEQFFVLKPSTAYSLHITAKRYRSDKFLGDGSQSGAITLVLLHATSLHKETWEPTLECIFDLAGKGSHAHVNIHEAWSIECPNHGQSAVLNDAQLQHGGRHHCNCKLFLAGYFLLCSL